VFAKKVGVAAWLVKQSRNCSDDVCDACDRSVDDPMAIVAKSTFHEVNADHQGDQIAQRDRPARSVL
jgi:hypothetical protein